MKSRYLAVSVYLFTPCFIIHICLRAETAKRRGLNANRSRDAKHKTHIYLLAFCVVLTSLPRYWLTLCVIVTLYFHCIVPIILCCATR